jgi:hypothetical protein
MPKLTPLKVASGKLLITGVESVDNSSSTKAAKNRIDRGVAGRSMMAKNGLSLSEGRLARYRPRDWRVVLRDEAADASVVVRRGWWSRHANGLALVKRYAQRT